MEITWTVVGLLLNGIGALIVATFEPNPRSIAADLSPDHPEFPNLAVLSWAGRKLNSFRRPHWEEDPLIPRFTAQSERFVRLWFGWGGFIMGVVAQIVGETI